MSLKITHTISGNGLEFCISGTVRGVSVKGRTTPYYFGIDAPPDWGLVDRILILNRARGTLGTPAPTRAMRKEAIGAILDNFPGE